MLNTAQHGNIRFRVEAFPHRTSARARLAKATLPMPQRVGLLPQKARDLPDPIVALHYLLLS